MAKSRGHIVGEWQRAWRPGSTHHITTVLLPPFYDSFHPRRIRTHYFGGWSIERHSVWKWRSLEWVFYRGWLESAKIVANILLDSPPLHRYSYLSRCWAGACFLLVGLLRRLVVVRHQLSSSCYCCCCCHFDRQFLNRHRKIPNNQRVAPVVVPTVPLRQLIGCDLESMSYWE